VNRPSLQRSKPIALPIAVALIAGACTMIDYSTKPSEDFPKLEIQIVDMSVWEVAAKCGGIPIIYHVFACVFTDFDEVFNTNVCTIYTHSRAEWLIEHETAHCKGYDHIGSSELREAWEAWKRKLGR